MQTTDPLHCVDGHEFPDTESCLVGDGQYPPFRVFDISAQDYVGETYATREAAQVEADRLNDKPMQNDEALDVVEAYRKEHGLLGTLEALTEMEKVSRSLYPRQRKAWNLAMRGFNRLFNGDENVRQI